MKTNEMIRPVILVSVCKAGVTNVLECSFTLTGTDHVEEKIRTLVNMSLPSDNFTDHYVNQMISAWFIDGCEDQKHFYVDYYLIMLSSQESSK